MSSVNVSLKNESQVQSSEVGKVLNIVLWVFQVLVAGMFLMSAYGKLSGAEAMVSAFNMIGIGQWFRYVTGGIELVAAILLFIPTLSGIGAALLVPTMIGAVITHIFILGGSFAPAAVLLVVSAFIAWGRKEHILNLIK